MRVSDCEELVGRGDTNQMPVQSVIRNTITLESYLQKIKLKFFIFEQEIANSFEVFCRFMKRPVQYLNTFF